MELSDLAAKLEALGNETRLAIFRTLVRAGDAGLPVGALQQRTDVPRSTLSHHLHKLIAVGLVSQRRERTTLYCCVDYEAMRATLGLLLDECCADAANLRNDVA